MKYLKLFDNEDNYLAYRDDKDKYIKSNISFCDGNGNVYYNYPPQIATNIVYGYVDLNLPSGTKWATQNVGASKPSESGLFFQFGETKGYTAEQIGTGEGKKAFNWNNYKWNPSGDGKTFIKYKLKGGQVLSLEDDAAHINMGGHWKMPNPDQIKELISTDNTTSAWTTSDGVSGVTFTSKKDTSRAIFFPATGHINGADLKDAGSKGYIWSSTLRADYLNSGQILYMLSNASILETFSRYEGLPVRGVI